jgi:putative inorganic carbon (HCO3(-)) transporter
MPLRTTILLAFFGLSLPVCFRHPIYGILLWTVVAFANPQSYVWSVEQAVPWAMAVAIPTLAGMVIFCRGWMERLRCREVLLLILMWLWFTATSLVSAAHPSFGHHASDTWFRWEMVTKALLMTVVTVIIIERFNQLRLLILVIAGSFGFFVVKALPFLVLTGGSYKLYGPAKSMIADNNDFGLALNMTVPIFFFLAQSESRKWIRTLFWGLTLATVPAVFFTYSRGAMLGLAVTCSLMLLRSKMRLALVPMIVLGAALALLFAPESWKNRMNPTQGADASAQARFHAWSFAWKLANDSPVTGGGFETFTPQLYGAYTGQTISVPGPHSVYFGVLAEHGFPGLALYLLVAYSAWSGTTRLARSARHYNDWSAECYANMFRFSIVAFLTSGAFLGRAYFDYYFTILACVGVLRRLCAEAWARDVEEDLDEREYEVTRSPVNTMEARPA